MERLFGEREDALNGKIPQKAGICGEKGERKKTLLRFIGQLLLPFSNEYDIIKSMDDKRLENLNPVTLAYIGDAVYTLYVRARLVESSDFKTGRLGKICSNFVRASTQSEILERTSSVFTGEEADVARRCRNAHTPAKAKNASMSEYKRATALEGILGYLYLSKRRERLEELLGIFFDETKNMIFGGDISVSVGKGGTCR